MNIEELETILDINLLPNNFEEKIWKFMFENKEPNSPQYHWRDTFFSRTYATILMDMIHDQIPLNVIDIGCNFGFQSEFFLDGKYTGVDTDFPHFGGSHRQGTFSYSFFNQGKPNVHYLLDTFPNNNLNNLIKDKTVISSMCLGFFEPKTVTRKELIDTYNKYCNSLAHAKRIYLRTTPLLSQVAQERFNKNNLKIFKVPKDCHDNAANNSFIRIEP